MAEATTAPILSVIEDTDHLMALDASDGNNLKRITGAGLRNSLAGGSSNPYFYNQSLDIASPSTAITGTIRALNTAANAAKGGIIEPVVHADDIVIPLIPETNSTGGIRQGVPFMTLFDGSVTFNVGAAGASIVAWLRVTHHFLGTAGIPAGVQDRVDYRRLVVPSVVGEPVTIPLPAFNSSTPISSSTPGVSNANVVIPISVDIVLQAAQSNNYTQPKTGTMPTISNVSIYNGGVFFHQLRDIVGAQGPKGDKGDAGNDGVDGTGLPATTGHQDGSLIKLFNGSWTVVDSFPAFVPNTIYEKGQVVRIDSAGNGITGTLARWRDCAFMAVSDRADPLVVANNVVQSGWVQIHGAGVRNAVFDTTSRNLTITHENGYVRTINIPGGSGSTLTGTQIVALLEALTGSARLDYSAIDNTPTIPSIPSTLPPSVRSVNAITIDTVNDERPAAGDLLVTAAADEFQPRTINEILSPATSNRLLPAIPSS